MDSWPQGAWCEFHIPNQVLLLGICPQLLKVLLLGQAVTTPQLNEAVMVSYREKGSMSIKHNDVAISFSFQLSKYVPWNN